MMLNLWEGWGIMKSIECFKVQSQRMKVCGVQSWILLSQLSSNNFRRSQTTVLWTFGAVSVPLFLPSFVLDKLFFWKFIPISRSLSGCKMNDCIGMRMSKEDFFCLQNISDKEDEQRFEMSKTIMQKTKIDEIVRCLSLFCDWRSFYEMSDALRGDLDEIDNS